MKGSPASSLSATCNTDRVALALDADLAQEAVSKLQQYLQLRTSSRSAAPEALTSDELDAAARMYALEVCNDPISSTCAHVVDSPGLHLQRSSRRRLHGTLASPGGSMHLEYHGTSCRQFIRLQSSLPEQQLNKPCRQDTEHWMSASSWSPHSPRAGLTCCMKV